jgi:IS4 transposase
MKKDSLMVKDILEKGQTSMITTITFDDKTIRFRIIVYEVDEKKYFLGTTIMNHSVAYFKNIYWKRWRVEVNFKESKYLLSLNDIKSKSENKVQQDIYSHNILCILCSFFKNHLNQIIPDNRFINTKNLYHMLTADILFIMLYKKFTSSTKKNLIKCYRVCLRH